MARVTRICNLSIFRPSHLNGVNNPVNCAMTCGLLNSDWKAFTRTRGQANLSIANIRYCQSDHKNPWFNDFKNSSRIKGENNICKQAKRATNPRIEAKVLSGFGEPTHSINRVTTLTITCQEGAVTRKRETNTSPAERKEVHSSH